MTVGGFGAGGAQAVTHEEGAVVCPGARVRWPGKAR